MTRIDAVAFRQTYNAGFQAWANDDAEQQSIHELRDRLKEHITLLLPEVQDLTARMSGTWRRLGIHVLIRAHHLMKDNGRESPEKQAGYVQDLAALSRSLLALYERPGPLGLPTDPDEITAAIHRRVCESCQQEIREGEPHTPAVFASDSGGGTYGWLHAEDCPPAADTDVPSPLHP